MVSRTDNVPDNAFPTRHSSTSSNILRHPLGAPAQRPIPRPSLPLSRARNPPSYRSGRRSRTAYSFPTKSFLSSRQPHFPPAHHPLLSINLSRPPRYHPAMYSQDRAPVLANAVCPSPPAKPAVRVGAGSRESQNRRRISPDSAATSGCSGLQRAGRAAGSAPAPPCSTCGRLGAVQRARAVLGCSRRERRHPPQSPRTGGQRHWKPDRCR